MYGICLLERFWDDSPLGWENVCVLPFHGVEDQGATNVSCCPGLAVWPFGEKQ